MSTPDAAAWDERYRRTDHVWSLEPNQFVVEHLSELPIGSMLDLGGGEGRNSLWFAGRGWTVENSDLSAVAVSKFLERAKDLGLADRCTGTVGSATESSACTTGPVDLVVCAYLQLPEEMLDVVIHTASDALVIGGTFFGVWHARENLTHGWGGPQHEAVLPRLSELVEGIRRAGLTLVKAELVDRYVTVDGQTHKAIDVLVRATRK